MSNKLLSRQERSTGLVTQSPPFYVVNFPNVTIQLNQGKKYTVKTNPCFRYEGKRGEYRNLVTFRNTGMNNHIKGELSTRPFHRFVQRFIFTNNQITLSPCFTFLSKTGVGLNETGVSFHCVEIDDAAKDIDRALWIKFGLGKVGLE